jgi:hypothetical protein
MQLADRTGTSTWFVERDRVKAKPHVRKGLRRGAGTETSLRAIIATSLFLVLLAASLLIGGHAAVDPILRLAIAHRDSAGRGDVLYSMPDGKYCRHMSFDNATDEMIEGDIQRCPDDIVSEHGHSTLGFEWGAH